MSAQLYIEEVNDLLAAEGGRLQIHESREAGVHVAGLREEIVTSAARVLALLEQGEAARHVGETRMNKASSRSHTIFRMVRAARSAWHAASGLTARVRPLSSKAGVEPIASGVRMDRVTAQICPLLARRGGDSTPCPRDAHAV